MDNQHESYIDLLKKCLTASIYDESSWHVIDESMREPKVAKRPMLLAKRCFYDSAIRYFRKKSILLVKKIPFDLTQRNEGKDWPFFGYTMAGCKRLENVQFCIEDILSRNIPGDFIETGVWRGGTTIFMRALLKAHNVTDRTVWVADSFEGMPLPVSNSDGADLSQVQGLKVSLEQVKDNFEKFGLLDAQVKFLKGWFHDSLPHAPIARLSLLRLDGDMYSSTMDSLRSLYFKISVGGYVIVDDYYSWESCRRAVSDFLTENGIEATIKRIDWTGAYWKVEN